MVTDSEGNFGNSIGPRSHADLLTQHYGELVEGGIPVDLAVELTLVAARNVDMLVVRVAK